MRFHAYLRTASTILQAYHGALPFHIFAKNFFSRQKKFGSTDRKTITHICYCYFRLGKAVRELPVDERLLFSLFICAHESDPVLEALRPEWNAQVHASTAEKSAIAQIPFQLEAILPWKELLSGNVDHHDFCASFLYQPRLFLRIRPGNEKNVIQKLEQAGIKFEKKSNDSLSLPASSKLDNLISLNREAVVQDLSSQQVAAFFPVSQSEYSAWDCCAGSGGKSILLYDHQPHIRLTVSDKRESIISNLKTRFKEAGIIAYQTLVTDLENEVLPKQLSNPGKPFDLIMADVPCTGSGTWARTPEQLYFHETATVAQYQHLQRRILQRVMPQLGPGCHFLYITCSVFKAENEDNVEWAVNQFGLKLVKTNVVKGYQSAADTMFAALFTL